MEPQERIDQLIAEIGENEAQIALLQQRIDEAKRELGTLDVSWATWHWQQPVIISPSESYGIVFCEDAPRVFKFTKNGYEEINVADLPVEYEEFDQDE